MGIFSVVIWNSFWLNPKKQRDVNKQNSSSHLNTGTYKLGENNWKSWLVLGQADIVEPRTHNLPLWHWVFIRPNFCSMISSLCWWRWTSVVTQHSNEFGQLAPIAYLPLSACWNLTKNSLVLHGVSSWFFSYADGNYFLKICMWQEEMFSRKSRCLENGFPFVLPCPLQNPIISVLINSLTIMCH